MGFDTQVIVGNREGLVIEKENVVYWGTLNQRSMRPLDETVFARRREILCPVARIIIHRHESAPRFQMAGDRRAHFQQFSIVLSIVEQIGRNHYVKSLV